MKNELNAGSVLMDAIRQQKERTISSYAVKVVNVQNKAEENVMRIKLELDKAEKHAAVLAESLKKFGESSNPADLAPFGIE